MVALVALVGLGAVVAFAVAAVLSVADTSPGEIAFALIHESGTNRGRRFTDRPLTAVTLDMMRGT